VPLATESAKANGHGHHSVTNAGHGRSAPLTIENKK
jgi:hypothetical protein